MIGLLIPLLRVPDSFVATAEVLMDILTKSSMQDGKGGKILTEPLLDFIVAVGPTIVQESLSSMFFSTFLPTSWLTPTQRARQMRHLMHSANC